MNKRYINIESDFSVRINLPDGYEGDFKVFITSSGRGSDVIEASRIGGILTGVTEANGKLYVLVYHGRLTPGYLRTKLYLWINNNWVRGLQQMVPEAGEVIITTSYTNLPDANVSLEVESSFTVGPQGEQGEPGPRGEQGPQGIPGPQGRQGPKGDTGDTGPAGPQGPKGDTGATGTAGPQGPKGDKGEKGDKGDIGPAGPQGVQGEKGEKGDTGDTGAQGLQGLRGMPGATGPKGDKGDKGNTGETGPQGPQGATGPAGPQGEQGATGPAGPRGEQGPKGEDGKDGKDGTGITLKSTASECTVTGDAYLDDDGNILIYNAASGTFKNGGQIKGPKGDTGATGATGPQGSQGEKGEKGDKGDTGPQGPKGDKGDIGATGPTGPKGDTGDTGLQGEKGDTGATGPTGPAGPQGPQGIPGPVNIDSSLSSSSANPVRNSAIKNALDGKADKHNPTVTGLLTGQNAKFSGLVNTPNYLAVGRRIENVLSCSIVTTTYETVIKTKIPFEPSRFNLVHIKGFAYGFGYAIEMTFTWYHHPTGNLDPDGIEFYRPDEPTANLRFYNPSMISQSPWKPNCYLFAYQDSTDNKWYAAISLVGEVYFLLFQTDYTNLVGDPEPISYEGWSIEYRGNANASAITGKMAKTAIEYKRMATDIEGNARTATRADQDAVGRDITDTYVTKASFNSQLGNIETILNTINGEVI